MDKKYKKTFLKRVIVRLDFATREEEFENKVPADLVKEALKTFPLEEPQSMIVQEVAMTQESLKKEERRLKYWYYHGRNREKTLCIMPEALSVDHKEYKSFDNFKEEFLGISDTLFKSRPNLEISRLGLRYINSLENLDGAPTEWKDYLSEKLLATFEIPKSRDQISRALNTLVLNFGDMDLRFKYGMHNPDFPAPIRKKIFILDYDASYRGLVDKGDIKPTLNGFHQRIEDLFEECITDKLREVMLNG